MDENYRQGEISGGESNDSFGKSAGSIGSLRRIESLHDSIRSYRRDRPLRRRAWRRSDNVTIVSVTPAYFHSLYFDYRPEWGGFRLFYDPGGATKRGRTDWHWRTHV